MAEGFFRAPCALFGRTDAAAGDHDDEGDVSRTHRCKGGDPASLRSSPEAPLPWG